MKNEDKKDEKSEDEEEVEAKYQNPILVLLPATTTGLISVVFWSSCTSSRR
jgi:hypothetical protein